MKRVLSLFTLILSGLLLSSLWILENDEWKIYLPLILISISLFMIKESQSYSDNE